MSLTPMSHTVRDHIILRLGNGIELFDSIDCCDQDSSFADESAVLTGAVACSTFDE